jgi:hypothetical protein
MARRHEFYSGEQMEPIGILNGDASARFVARGWVPTAEVEAPEVYRERLGDRIWGIVIERDGGPADDGRLVTLDDGRQVTAALAEPIMSGEPASVLANARYWELDPPYVVAIRETVNALTAGNDED